MAGQSLTPSETNGLVAGEDDWTSSSLEDSSDDDTSSSEESESSDDSNDESEDEHESDTLPPLFPNHAVMPRFAVPRSDLSSRLSSFIPSLQAANSQLDGKQHRIEIDEGAEIDEGDAHVEMNVGLGVLEEKTGDSSSSDSSEEGDVDNEFEATETSPSTHMSRNKPPATANNKRKRGVLDVLMGKEKMLKPSIEIVAPVPARPP